MFESVQTLYIAGSEIRRDRAAMVNIRSALVCAAAVVASVSWATANDVPSFWDSRQHLTAPDMAAFPRLRFLTTTDFFPFSMLDNQGNLIGFHVDLARAICRQLEVESRCQIQALPFDELGDALRNNDGEAIIAGMAITPENRTSYSFSLAYFQFPARFVARQSAPLDEPLFRSVEGKRVGVLRGSAHEKMLRDLFAGAEVAPYPDDPALFDALRKNEIAAIFGDGVRLSFAMADAATEGCCTFVGGPYLAPEYLGRGLAIAARPDQSALIAAFDYALQRLEAEGRFEELYLRYFPVNIYEQAAR